MHGNPFVDECQHAQDPMGETHDPMALGYQSAVKESHFGILQNA
jgi:hypothetical protein